MINCLEVGGAQQMALQVFDLMEKNLDQVYLITIDGTWEMPFHPHEARARQLAQKAVRLSHLETSQPVVKKILAAPLQYLRLQRTIKKLGLDILISFEDRANIFNMLVVFVSKRIISIRHPMKSVLVVKTRIKKALIFLFFYLFVRRVSMANFNSQASMMEFVSLFPIPKIQRSVIYNFCDHERLDGMKNILPKDSEARKLLSQPFILACGRFKPVKGFVNLIRSFQKVAQAYPDLYLIVLGDGPLKPELMQLAGDLDLKDRVVFPGFRRNTAPWLARARVFVLSSQSEGFPNVLLEAMALKTAVVSVDCTAGPREILSPDTDFTRKTKQVDRAPFGILTPPISDLWPASGSLLDWSEQCLADAILSLLKDPDLRSRYEKNGYIRSLDFSVTAQQTKWLDLVDSAPAGAKPGTKPNSNANELLRS